LTQAEARPQLQFELPAGVEGVRETLKIMRRLVRHGRSEPLVRATAVALVSHVDQKDWAGEVAAVFAYVQGHVRFLRDINEVETLHSATAVIEQAAGDCDDKMILLAALLETIGYPTRLVAMGFAPGDFSHVILEVRLRGNWVPLDPSEPYPAGWTPPDQRERMLISNGDA
jgi:transglutaminase-like putative cysteine protease